ncbi:hypothetical protein QBC37DRAFT_427957 [Rhypophila decipiens]|uniref:Uncharacterized protein n=1 Tax=Rhypophila decipiens TaxID=261697 RepID=A0AAN7B312_9PEZI|nr:hypothetical protein QBC37DRAFT_427957 [Rhypophila decipiens]
MLNNCTLKPASSRTGTTDGFPSRSTWPLELLVIGDATGQTITAGPIVNGEIQHLVFYLTCNLRFGPQTDGYLAVVMEDLDDISEWLINKQTGLLFYETTGSASESKLRKLEILENDAIEIFVRFTVAHPETIMTVQELTIRSLDGCCDMGSMPGGILGAVLPHLESLRHLDLGLCYDVYFPVLESEFWKPEDREQRSPPWLVQGLPPNLETLYFRGPMEIAHGNEGRWLVEWTEAFRNSDYLPRLKSVGFWLDQPGKDGDGPEKDTRFPEKIQTARMKVEEVLGPVLRKRGIHLVDWDEDGAWRDHWFDMYWPEMDDVMDQDE